MSDQKNWDAALINTWRRAGNLMDAFSLFKALSGKKASECDPPLKRVPKEGYPWKIGVRVFVADNLEKISNRLWEQPPEKDILLLRKLETSPYDTTDKTQFTDNELHKVREQGKRNILKIQSNNLTFKNTRQASDWGVTTVSTRVKRIRR